MNKYRVWLYGNSLIGFYDDYVDVFATSEKHASETAKDKLIRTTHKSWQEFMFVVRRIEVLI